MSKIPERRETLPTQEEAAQKTKDVRIDTSGIAAAIRSRIMQGFFFVDFQSLTEEQIEILRHHGYTVEPYGATNKKVEVRWDKKHGQEIKG